jgi:hypothetical protein
LNLKMPLDWSIDQHHYVCNKGSILLVRYTADVFNSTTTYYMYVPRFK